MISQLSQDMGKCLLWRSAWNDTMPDITFKILQPKFLWVDETWRAQFFSCLKERYECIHSQYFWTYVCFLKINLLMNTNAELPATSLQSFSKHFTHFLTCTLKTPPNVGNNFSNVSIWYQRNRLSLLPNIAVHVAKPQKQKIWEYFAKYMAK